MSYVLISRKTEADAPSSKANAVTTGLRIGVPNDSFEQEADRVADEVVPNGKVTPEWSLSRMSLETPTRDAPTAVHEVLGSSGKHLENSARSHFESRFGHDFSQVRVHTDEKAAESARAIGASAYTAGREVVFGTGNYDPQSLSGRRLIAHELAHVLQQQGQGALAVQRAPAEQPLFWWHMRGPSVLEAKRGLNRYHQQEQAAGRQGFGQDWQPLAENDFVDDQTPPALGKFQRQRRLRHQDSKVWQETLDALSETSTTAPASSIEPQRSKPATPQSRPVGASGVQADTNVPWSDRDPLPRSGETARDYAADATYIDNIVHASYDILSNRFQVQHQDGTSIDLDADSIQRVARTGPGQKPAREGIGGLFFLNKSNGKIYPVHFTAATIPTIVWAWREIERQTPEALENTKQALIDVAIAAHGAAQAGVKLGQKLAEPEGAGAGTQLKPSQAARREFAKLEPVYAQKLGVPAGGVVHHAKELQLLDRYPGAFTSSELNEFKNMRGIKPEFNDTLHLSGFRRFWNEAYEFMDNVIKERKLTPGTPEYNDFVRSVADRYFRRIDDEFGHLFTEFGKVLKK